MSVAPAALASAQEIIDEAKQGKMFILVDDEDRENEGDLIIPAQAVTAQHINFMAKYGRGLICLALDSGSVSRLNLDLMPQSNSSRFGTAFTISIESREGVTTGISAADRAKTIQTACDPAATARDIVTPGHIFPLAARDGGVLVRAGHTEASVDIARLAGHHSAGVICEIMNDQGEMMRLGELLHFAGEHGLKIGTIADLIAYRRRHDRLIKLIHTSKINIEGAGEFSLSIYQNQVDGIEHLALVRGNPVPDKPTIVRMHAFHVFKDLFLQGGDDSRIQRALAKMGDYDQAVFVLIRETNQHSLVELLGVAPEKPSNAPINAQSEELRDYGIGAQILLDIGVGRMILMSNHKRHVIGLEGYGLKLEDWVQMG
ncbi:MAG: 3,4-dihydroxy-2-butanone-4-phosphate synthase [Alphaproteobacteria bacterium]